MKIVSARESLAGDQRLLQYLLGLLPEQETERLDELSVVDDRVADRLCVIEDDLVDDYVIGALDAVQRQRFESFYMASPRRQQKVAFAKRFLRAVDRQARPASNVRVMPSVGPTVQQSPVLMPVDPSASDSWAGGSRRFLTMAAAALLVMACAGMYFQDVQLRRAVTAAQRDALIKGQRLEGLAAELNQTRASASSVTRELARSRASAEAAVAVVLPPPTRAVGPVPVIAVSVAGAGVPIDLRVEAGSYVAYTAILKDSSGIALWRSGTLTVQPSRQPAAVSLRIPGELLKAQHYLLELSGRRRTGGAEVLGSYAFQVERH